MDLQPDTVSEPMDQLMAGGLEALLREGRELRGHRPDHGGRAAPLLHFSYCSVQLALPCLRPATRDGASHVRVVAVDECPEVKLDQVAALELTVGGLMVRDGGVRAERDDAGECCTISPLGVHPFQQRPRDLLLRD